MKKKLLTFHLLAGFLVWQNSAVAHWGFVDTNNVPVDRLITNLESFEATIPKDKKISRARVEFQIGRLCSMAYAYRTDTAQLMKVPYERPHEASDALESRIRERVAKKWRHQRGLPNSGITVER